MILSHAGRHYEIQYGYHGSESYAGMYEDSTQNLENLPYDLDPLCVTLRPVETWSETYLLFVEAVWDLL